LTVPKKRLSLHVPADLKDWIEKEAEKESRTVNNFVVKVLQDKRREVNEQRKEY